MFSTIVNRSSLVAYYSFGQLSLFFIPFQDNRLIANIKQLIEEQNNSLTFDLVLQVWGQSRSRQNSRSPGVA